MSNVHMRSFWLGAHGSLAVVALLLLPLSLWFLPSAAISSYMTFINWSALQQEPK